MEKRKELLKIMLKKYNKQKIKVVDKIDPNFAGSLCNGDIKIVFNVDKDFLIIQDNITIDNIHLYYEFMSDEDILNNSVLIDKLFNRRMGIIYFNLKIDNFNLWLNDILSYKSDINDYMHELNIFDIKDNLFPIDDYIEEIKKSELYLIYKGLNNE